MHVHIHVHVRVRLCVCVSVLVLVYVFVTVCCVWCVALWCGVVSCGVLCVLVCVGMCVSARSTLKTSEIEQLYQVWRMIGGLGARVVLDLFSNLEICNIQWFLSVNLSSK